jgi:hypothetical protein
LVPIVNTGKLNDQRENIYNQGRACRISKPY